MSNKYVDESYNAQTDEAARIAAYVATATARPGNGTAPPAPTVTSSGNPFRGLVQFGSGSSPAVGDQVQVSHPAQLGSPVALIVPASAAATSVGAWVSAQTPTGFTIAFASAPTASQSGTTYKIRYIVS